MPTVDEKPPWLEPWMKAVSYPSHERDGMTAKYRARMDTPSRAPHLEVIHATMRERASRARAAGLKGLLHESTCMGHVKTKLSLKMSPADSHFKAARERSLKTGEGLVQRMPENRRQHTEASYEGHSEAGQTSEPDWRPGEAAQVWTAGEEARTALEEAMSSGTGRGEEDDNSGSISLLGAISIEDSRWGDDGGAAGHVARGEEERERLRRLGMERTCEGAQTYRHTHTHSHFYSQQRHVHTTRLLRSEAPCVEFNFVGYHGDLQKRLQLIDDTLIAVHQRSQHECQGLLQGTSSLPSSIHVRNAVNQSLYKQMAYFTSSMAAISKYQQSTRVDRSCQVGTEGDGEELS